MTGSLRLRLFVIILIPLTVAALAVGTWRIVVAQETAGALFDRNLMFTALAVSRDVALSDGDAISAETQRLLGETAGGPVRYHVYGPDGVLVTGYAVPPVPLSRRMPADRVFAYYDATYKGDPVRVLRIRHEAVIDDLSGMFTTTVWQALGARNAFVWQLALRSVFVIATLIGAVALIVWFGVRFGLKPLTDLEDAISQRSSEDLSPIRRAVPVEARGLVARLNSLFAQVRATLEAQSAFVSDAAHQLRNPIAGLRALGEAIQTAPTLDAAQARARELVAAASGAGKLANRLLTLERARAETGSERLRPVDLVAIVERATAVARPAATARAVTLDVSLPDAAVTLPGDDVMLGEALANLIDNALVHGGPELRKIEVALAVREGGIRLTVSDDGRPVAPEEVPTILARFGQSQPGSGSGLGLSIAEAVALRHGGSLEVHNQRDGFSVSMSLPLADARRPAA